MKNKPDKFVLMITCPDKPGIIAAVSSFLYDSNFNILESSQFRDYKNNHFFMRVKFTAIKKIKSHNETAKIFNSFEKTASKFKMNYEFFDMSKKQKILLMVSKFGHCLNNILYQWKSGIIRADIPIIVSNHEDLREVVEPYGIEYIYMPINKKNKQNQEFKLQKLIKNNNIDLVVLARYMQVLSSKLCNAMHGKIINIHHSFLPSFKGARPYNQAFEKGVKIIGATAHYVTKKLDEGQIIEQDVARVDHTKTLENFVSIGRDIENVVLSRAINWHIEHRVIINENRTIVFN